MKVEKSAAPLPDWPANASRSSRRGFTPIWPTGWTTARGAGCATAAWPTRRRRCVRRTGLLRAAARGRKLISSERFDGIVALGVVVRGETPHFDFVAGECARGIMDVADRDRHADRLRGADDREPRAGRASC